MLANLTARARQALRHVAVRNALFLYGVQFTTYVFPFVTLSFLSRTISPDKIGLIGVATTFMWYFMTITDYGFNLTATRRIAIQKESPDAVNQIFNSVILTKGVLTAAGFVLMMVIVFMVPTYRDHWLLFPLCFLNVVGNWLFPMWLYQGMEKMGQVAVRDFTAKLLATVLTLLVVRRESDYLYAAGIQAGAAALSGALSLALAPRVCGVRFMRIPWSNVLTTLRQGWPVFLSQAAISLTSTNVVLLTFVTTNKEIAFYTTANRLVVNMRMLVIPISTALYPHISHMASKSVGNTVAFLRKYALVMAAPFFFMSLVAFILAPYVIPILFGGKKFDYTPSILQLRILAFSPFFLALSNTYSTYYMLGFGFEKQYSRIILQSVALNYVVLGLLFWVIHLRPITSVSVVNIVLDLFTLGSAYYFFRSNTSKAQPELGVTVS